MLSRSMSVYALWSPVDKLARRPALVAWSWMSTTLAASVAADAMASSWAAARLGRESS